MRLLSTLSIVLFLALAAPDAPTAAGPDASTWFSFLEETYDLHDDTLDEFLVAEFDRFLQDHPDDPRAAHALFYAGNLLVEKQEHEALRVWLKDLVLYPEFEQKKAANEGVLHILADGRRYDETAPALREMLTGLPVRGDGADAEYRFLEMLTVVRHKAMCESALAEYYRYLSRFPGDERCAQVLHWQADALVELGEESAAVATLKKAEKLYPFCELLPRIKHRRALLTYEDLKDPVTALAILTELHSQYPDPVTGAGALYDRGRIKAAEKDPEGAADDFRMFVGRYPDDPRVLDVMFELVDISYKELKAWERTDAVLEDIVERFPGNERAIEALEMSARLNRDKTGDYARAAAQLARIGRLFPGYEDAPRSVLQAARLAETKVENYALAIDYYEQVMSTWPDSEHSRKAEKGVAKARQKLAGE